MIPFIVIAVIITIFFGWAFIDSFIDPDPWDGRGWIVAGWLSAVGIFFAAFLMLDGLVVSLGWVQPKETMTQYNIVALADNPTTNADIYLRRAHIETTMSYFYMRQFSNGDLKMEHIPTDSTIIRFSETEQGYIQRSVNKYYNHWLMLFEATDKPTYIIYLPKSAELTNDFIIDME